MIRTLFGALSISAALAAPALAQEEQLCMAPVAITAAIVRDASMFAFNGYASMFAFNGYAGEGAIPAFIIGHLSSSRDTEDAHDVFGTVVFLRDADGGWRAFLPRPGESSVGLYVSPSTGGIALATQWQTEGPGQTWTLLRTSDGFATGACVNIDFPDMLNQPSWMNESLNLVDLDIAANGRGEIVGMAHTEAHGILWYAYRTRDHGANWGPPRRLRGERQVRAGLYMPIPDENPAPEALVADLQRFAAGR